MTATKEKEISKTQRVRDYIKQHPKAKPSEIVEALAEHGVSAQTIYAMRSKAGKLKKKKAKAVKAEQNGAEPVVKRGRKPKKKGGENFTADDLFRMKSIVDSAGIEGAKSALKTLEVLLAK